MGKLGALDFAGGNVVHINAGVAGLVLSTLVGKRIGYGKEAIFTASGTLIVGYITKLVTGGLRVEEDSEVTGLDNTVHGERAFEIQLS